MPWPATTSVFRRVLFVTSSSQATAHVVAVAAVSTARDTDRMGARGASCATRNTLFTGAPVTSLFRRAHERRAGAVGATTSALHTAATARKRSRA
jgi:hypothetical protein